MVLLVQREQTKLLGRSFLSAALPPDPQLQRTERWAHQDEDGSRTEEPIVITNEPSRFLLLT